MSRLTAFLVTLSMALTASVAALANAEVSSCIENLNQKTVSLKFRGSDSNIWNKLNRPYEATIAFDKTKHGGQIVYTSNWGIDTQLTIKPFDKEIIRELPTRHDQEIGERNVILLDCSDERYKNSCAASAQKFFKELVLIQSRAVEQSADIEKAIQCTLEMLKYSVL